jgi:hypothetical protein
MSSLNVREYIKKLTTTDHNESLLLIGWNAEIIAKKEIQADLIIHG